MQLYTNIIRNNQFNNEFNLDKINVNPILSSLPSIDTFGGFGINPIKNNNLTFNPFFPDLNFLIFLLSLILSNFGNFPPIPNLPPTPPISSPISLPSPIPPKNPRYKPNIRPIQPNNITPTLPISRFITTPQIAGFNPPTQNIPINQPTINNNNQNNQINFQNQENQAQNPTNNATNTTNNTTNNTSNAAQDTQQNAPTNQQNNQNNQNREYDIEFIKRFEGFSPTPYGDYQQLSIGYGTRAKSPNEVITKEEAEQRMIEHIENVVKPGIINIIGQERWNNLDYNQKTALISLAYNLGVPGSSEILKLVRDGNIQGAAEEMKQYVHANGQVLEGLVRRREAEAKLLLS